MRLGPQDKPFPLKTIENKAGLGFGITAFKLNFMVRYIDEIILLKLRLLYDNILAFPDLPFRNILKSSDTR